MKGYAKTWFLLCKNAWWRQKILKYNPGEKSLKAPHIICADLECLLEKIDTCKNNLEKSYTKKKAKHIPPGYSLVTCFSYDKSKNERKYYRGEDCMEMSSKDLKEQAMKVIKYEKKEMVPLTNEEKELYEIRKFIIYVKKNLELIKNTVKSEIIVIIQENIEELLIVFVI